MRCGSRTALFLSGLLAISACADVEPPPLPNVKAAQTITFASLPHKVVTDPPFTLTATASSGLPVTFDAEGVCSVADTTLTLDGAIGTCRVTAFQPGDDAYLPASDVPRTFFVLAVDDERTPQSITFPALPNKVVTDPPFTVAVTASSGLPVDLSAEGVCSVAGTTVTLDGESGACRLFARQDGDETYLPAVPVQRAFDVVAPDDAPRQIGFVLVSETGAEGARVVDATGTFVSRNDPFGDDFPGDPFPDGDGTCLVTSAEDVDPGDDPMPDSDVRGIPIDAGTPLVLRVAGTAYGELVSEGTGTYRLNGAVRPEAPLPTSDLTLDVPGATFPAIAGAPFAATPAFVLDPGIDTGAVTRDTTFAWQGSDASEAAVLLIGTDGDTAFSCVVRDDGSFSFDAGTRASLDAAGFESGALRAAGRLTIRATDVNGSDLLLGILTLSSYEGDLAAASGVPTALVRRAVHFATLRMAGRD